MFILVSLLFRLCPSSSLVPLKRHPECCNSVWSIAGCLRNYSISTFDVAIKRQYRHILVVNTDANNGGVLLFSFPISVCVYTRARSITKDTFSSFFYSTAFHTVLTFIFTGVHIYQLIEKLSSNKTAISTLIK